MSDVRAELWGPLVRWGYHLIETECMTVLREQEVVRTWKERLLTLPWRPLRRTKTVMVTAPNPELYLAGYNIYGHPETIAQLREALAGD